MTRSPITCHVLDASLGKPGADIVVSLWSVHNGVELSLWANAKTDNDGRCNNLLEPTKEIHPGMFRVRFETKEYFERTKRDTFFPFVEITFELKDPSQHYHIPLLLSPHSYTTYRGS